MSHRPIRVLFLCTHNSARSVLSECLLRDVGGEGFEAHSAGSQPKGRVNPFALEVLQNHGHDVSGLTSKSWDAFSGPQAIPLDFSFTLCDSAANETCPLFTGAPLRDHWGMPDPSAVDGGEAAQRAAFEVAYGQIKQHVEAFRALMERGIAEGWGEDKTRQAIQDFSADVRVANEGLAERYRSAI